MELGRAAITTQVALGAEIFSTCSTAKKKRSAVPTTWRKR